MFSRKLFSLLRICPLLLLALSSFAHASSNDFYYSFTSNHEEVELHLHKYKNAFGQIEVDAKLVEDHWLMPDSESPLLYGIDRDGDGYPETWFYRKGDFVENVFFHRPENEYTHIRNPNGEDAIMDIVGHLQLNERWMPKVVASRAAGFISSAISSGQAALEQFFQDQLYSYQLDFAANELPDNAPEAILMHAMSKRAWDLAAETVRDQTGGVSYLERGGVDILLFAVGMKAFKYIGKAGGWAVNKFAMTETGGVIIAGMENIASKVQGGFTDMADAIVTTVKNQAEYLGGAAVDVSTMSLQSIRVTAVNAIKFVSARKKMTQNVLGKLASTTGTVYKTGFREWDYVLQTQGLQIIAETMSRHDEIYDPNPIVMEKKLFEDKDFRQNLAFMTNETLLQTGVHMGTGSASQRFLLAGFVSLIDSGLMNFLIKGNVDGTRAMGDTGWEVTIGNFQTFLDNAIFRTAGRNMINHSSTLGGKLMGYVIFWLAPAADQYAGYVGYAKATTSYEAWKKAADDKTTVPKNALPTLKIMPVVVVP